MQHKTSSGGIIMNTTTKNLVFLENKGLTWGFPKGKQEEGETLLETAKREIYEETGLNELTLVKDLGSYERFQIGDDGKPDPNFLKTIHLFLFTTNETQLTPQDKDITQIMWIDKDEIKDKFTHLKDKEFYEKCYPILEESFK